MELDDPEKYVIVVSSIMRTKFIEMDIFDHSEVYIILRQIQLIILGMRTPDLEFLTLNDFNDIKNSDFFRIQEILYGKSIMDICLSDPEAIKTALHQYDQHQDNLVGSINHMIAQGDDVRKACFKEIDLYTKQ